MSRAEVKPEPTVWVDERYSDTGFVYYPGGRVFWQKSEAEGEDYDLRESWGSPNPHQMALVIMALDTHYASKGSAS